MQHGWIDRLWTAIAEDGRSERAISVAAGLGVNYVSQTRKRGTNPVSDNLASLLDVLGERAAIYVMTGVRLTPEAVNALNALSDVPEHLRNQAMALILAIGDQPQQGPRSDEETRAADHPAG